MTDETKNVPHEEFPNAEREFYIGSAVLTALSVAIAIVAV